jgi:hypothetical protein
MKRLLAMAIGAWALFPVMAAEDAAKSGEDEKVVCKREKELGSNLGGRKICMTRAEWRREKEANERVLRGFDDRSSSEPLIPKGRGN